MRFGRSSVVALAVSLALAACGGAPVDDTGADPARPGSSPDAATQPVDADANDPAATSETESAPDAPAAEPDPEPDDTTESDDATEPDGAEQSDGEIVLPEPEPGPVPDLPVSPASAEASPFPEVAVRQLNGGGGWVQFKDLLPSEQPLLLWFWAPF